MDNRNNDQSVFSTTVSWNYDQTIEKSSLIEKSVSFNMLPVTVKDSSKKTKIEPSMSLPRNVGSFERSSDKTMLSGDFSSSSDEEDSINGQTNISFENEINSHVVLYNKFGATGTREGSIKDSPDIQYMEKGKCLISDLLNGRLMLFSKTGKNVMSLHNEDLVEPWGIAVHQDTILATSRRKKLVIKLPQIAGCDDSSFGESFFQTPCGVAVTQSHRIVVTDLQSRRVTVHEWNGNWMYDLTIPDNHNQTHPFKIPRYVTVSPFGDIVVSDSGNHCIFVFSEDGNFKTRFGCYGCNDGQLKSPYGVACDQFGNIFVADHYNDRISMFTEDGEFIRHVVTKSDGIFHPQGVSFSPDMKLYITHGSLKAFEIKVFSLLTKSIIKSPVFCI